MNKWAIEAYLADAYGIELGYVSRNNPKDFTNHVILGVDFYRTNHFISELSGLNIERNWGVFMHIVNTFKELEDGNYVLVRDPNEVNILITTNSRKSFKYTTSQTKTLKKHSNHKKIPYMTKINNNPLKPNKSFTYSLTPPQDSSLQTPSTETTSLFPS